MAHYHFRLSPLDRFFFGDERSFGAANNSNYYVQSRQWPQQTTLLGTLRFELLRRHGHVSQIGQSTQLAPDANDLTIPNLIGPGSFQPSHTELQSFGCIQRLSPVWLEYGGTPYVLAPLTGKLKIGAASPAIRAMSLSSEPYPEIPHTFWDTKGKPWLYKEGLQHALVPMGGATGPSFELGKVFLRSEQVGIIKKDGQDRDGGGFYRQVRYRLAEGWSFAFEAEITEGGNDPHHFQAHPKSQVTVGGEKQPFMLEATSVPSPKDFSPPAPTQESIQVHLLSDAYVSDPSALMASCQYAFTGEPVDFRNVQTHVTETKQYHNLTRRGQQRKAHRAAFSELLQLIPRGSVFGFTPAQFAQFNSMLDAAPNWQQIGYQAYQLIPTPQTQS